MRITVFVCLCTACVVVRGQPQEMVLVLSLDRDSISLLLSEASWSSSFEFQGLFCLCLPSSHRSPGVPESAIFMCILGFKCWSLRREIFSRRKKKNSTLLGSRKHLLPNKGGWRGDIILNGKQDSCLEPTDFPLRLSKVHGYSRIGVLCHWAPSLIF